MTANNHRKIRKIIAVLGMYRDTYAKAGNTGIASKFARAMAILKEILEEEGIDDH